jgi:Lon-like protease
MSGAVTIVDEVDGAAPKRPPRSPRASAGKWPLFLGVALLLAGVAIAIAWPINVPYYTLSPGPVYDTSDFIHADDAPQDARGELFFLTVSLKEANVFEWAAAHLTPKVDLAPRENIRPPGVSRDALRRQNLATMEQSKKDAQFVALTELGYEPTLIGTGAYVIETMPDTGAVDILQPGDVIIAIDGKPIGFIDELPDSLSGKEIGDSVVLTVQRQVGDNGAADAAREPDVEEIDLEVVLVPHVDDPERPMIGILVDNNPPIYQFPVPIEMDSQNIGGPSAGMMFTLEIINQLTPEDITHGQRIAGTGTIRRDGTVGPIGGVKQKVYAAIDAGATVVFIPADNYDDALAAAGDDIEVVRIETIEDPLRWLGVDVAALAMDQAA